jgi:hypothetical protein
MKALISKTVTALGFALVMGGLLTPAFAQPLGVDRFAGIHPGLSQDEVRSLIGDPGQVTQNTRVGETLWIYAFTDTWGYRSEYDVEFKDGHVSETFALRVQS